METGSEEVPTKVGAPSPVLSGDYKAVDFFNTSASGPSQRPGESASESSDSGVADSYSLERAPSPIFSKNRAHRSPRHPLNR